MGQPQALSPSHLPPSPLLCTETFLTVDRQLSKLNSEKSKCQKLWRAFHQFSSPKCQFKDSDGSAQVGVGERNFQSQQTVVASQCCKAASSASQTGASHPMAEAILLRHDYGVAHTGSVKIQITSRMHLSGGDPHLADASKSLSKWWLNPCFGNNGNSVDLCDSMI